MGLLERPLGGAEDAEGTALPVDAAAPDGASPLAARRGQSGVEGLKERGRAVGRALRGWLSAASVGS